MTLQRSRVGAIEAGGTKFIVSVGDHWDSEDTLTVPTSTPEETMGAVIEFLSAHHAREPLTALGVAAFGPIFIARGLPDYGVVGPTPKPGWEGYNYYETLLGKFDIPVGIETDVNAAALAEVAFGGHAEPEHLIYVTVGTGIGGGIVHNGATTNGIMHPEVGHMLVKRHAQDQDFPGVCPFHGDCLEGLAAGPSIKARWGVSLSNLAADHIAHDIEAYYLGQMCANLVLNHMPNKIIIGGGVGKTSGLLSRVRKNCLDALAGYLPMYNSEIAMQELICAPALGQAAGIAGAYNMAWTEC